MSGVEIEPVSRAREDGGPGVGPDEAFDTVENLLGPPGRGGDHGETEGGALAEIVVVHLGARNAESTPRGVEEVADDSALLLERATVGKVQLDLQGGDVHAQITVIDST
jgi:hypothetical protein